MDSREFFAGVVPWNTGDYINIHWFNFKSKHKGGMPGRSCKTIDEAFGIIKELQRRRDPVEIYFCISSQTVKDERLTKNASWLCCLPFDFDIGPDDPKKYATVEEAIEALILFCKKLGIPTPSACVLSGGGLHVYWWSNKYLTVKEWKVFAITVKMAALAFGLKIDPAVTGDVVRVLRCPGTNNNKYGEPRPVELLDCSGEKYDFSVIFGNLAVEVPRQQEQIQMAEAFRHLDPKQKLAEGVTIASLPVPFTPIKHECGWLRTAFETGGKDYDQPQWHLTTLCATFMEDGHNLAHKFGNQHPTYDPVKTDEMWDRKVLDRQEKQLGWPHCRTIHDTGGHAHCRACPHYPKDDPNSKQSPLHFGYQVAVEAEVNKEMNALGGTRPPHLRLPEGFCLNEKGQICAHIPTSGKKKTNPGHLMLLVSNQIRDPSLQRYGDQTGISFVTIPDRGREVEVFLDSSDVYRETGLLKTLPKNCMRYNPDPKAKTMVEKFFKSWLDKLAEEDTPAIRDPGMGWKYENGQRIGLVYASKMYHEDKRIFPLIQSANEERFYSYYMPTGSEFAWRKCCKLITDRKRPELNIIVAAAFAAPLTVFLGSLYGAFLSIWGEPGTAKSTAQQVSAAVWGHPKQIRESLTSTPKSIQGRMGRTKNLPVWQDDVQDERHQQMLCDGLFVITEGMEGGRLNSDATYKERLEWQSFVVVCSNASFVDFLVQKYKSTTAGIRRVFEIELNKNPNEQGIVNPLDAMQTFSELEFNYGCIGEQYAAILAQNHKEIAKLVTEITEAFRSAVKGTSDESYWWGLCGILLAGAVLAKEIGIDLDAASMQEFLIDAYYRNRKVRRDEGTEGGTLLNTEQAITGFLNTYLGNGNVMYTVKKFEHREIPMAVLAEPNAGRPIFIQVIRDARTVLISKRVFRKYLEDTGIRPRQVFTGMANFFQAKEVKHTLGAGTKHTQTQELCLEIVVPPGPGIFEGMISAYGVPETRPYLVPGTARDPAGP